ncbi:MAG: hypothetical protein JW937_10380, partial [Candidatus Omnitrophica bacterium]|nr:hypothetical protein [Candidatus Omnitrophota bacterium]
SVELWSGTGLGASFGGDQLGANQRQDTFFWTRLLGVDTQFNVAQDLDWATQTLGVQLGRWMGSKYIQLSGGKTYWEGLGSRIIWQNEYSGSVWTQSGSGLTLSYTQDDFYLWNYYYTGFDYPVPKWDGYVTLSAELTEGQGWNDYTAALQVSGRY